MNTNKFLGKAFVIISTCSLLCSEETRAQITYSTGEAAWNTSISGGGGEFAQSGGIGLFSFTTDVNWGVTDWRPLTSDGTLGGSALSLQVGQSLTIRVAGSDADGRTGVQNSGAIGFTLGAGSGAPSGGSPAAQAIDGSRFRVEFVGGNSTATAVGSSTISSGMPGFSDFKSGQTYTIEMISTNQINFRVAGGTQYNILDLGGTSGASIGRIQIYNRGQNMNGLFTALVVSNMPAISLSNNSGETSTISSVIAQNNGANNNIAKNGVGEVILTAANTFGGTVAVNNGTLRIANSEALGGTGAVTISSGATLALSNNVAENNAFTMSGTGSGGVGAVRSINGNNTLSGGITLGADVSVKSESGTTTTFSGGFTGAGRALTVNGDGNTTINATGINTSTGGSVTKNDGGTLSLSASGDYTGTTSVNAGTVLVANSSGLGATNGGTTVASGARVQLSNNVTVGSEALSLTGTGISSSGALQNVGGANTWQGAITLGGNARINTDSGSLSLAGAVSGGNNVFFVGGASNTALSGALSGGGASQDGTTTSLFKDGASTLTLSGNNSYSGDTRIREGTLTVASGGNLGDGTTDVYLTNGTRLNINASTTVASVREWADNTTGGVISVGSGATLTINGANKGTLFQNTISGDGSLTLAASGNTVLSLYAASGANALGGTFTISGGELGGSSTLTAANYALNGGAVTANLGAGTATASSGTTALNGTLGATTVNVSGGTMNLGSNDRLANGATVNVSNGALGMGGNTDTVGTLNVSGGSVTGSTGNKLTATAYNLTGGTVGANLGTGTLNANGGSATLNGTADATTVNVGGGSLGLGSANRLATSNAAVTISNSGTLTLGGNETIASLAGSGGTLALGNHTLSVGSGTFGSTIIGSGVLTKTGALTLTLSGNNSYSGGTLLNGGWLTAGHASAFGSGQITVGSGTTLNLTNFDVANVIVNNGGTILSTGTLDDVIATNGTSDIGGNNSVIEQVGGSAIVNVTGSSVVVSNATGGTLNADGSSVQVNSVSGGTVNLGGSSAVVTAASAGTVNANASGATLGTVSGAAAVNVAGANGRVGTLSGGSVAANAAGLVITNKTGGNIAVSNGVTVALRGGNSSGVISGAGGIAKQGATTLTLSGVNTYSGATAVEQGKLVVNGSANNSAVTVDSGATIGGGGSVLSLTLNGMLAPGNSAGTTTALTGAAWNQGGSYDWEIFDLAGPSGTGWDLLSVTGGTLDLTGITGPGGFTINLITLQDNNTTQGALTGFNASNNYTAGWMIASAPTITGFVASEFSLNKNLFVGGTGTFAIEQRAITGGQGLFITYNGGGGEPIPEPGTWAAAALLAGAAGYVRWRRRKQAEPKA